MKTSLMTVAQFAATTPFTEHQLRYWIFHAESNGLATSIVRIGRRVYIDSNCFDRWLEQQRAAPQQAVAA